MPSDMGDHHKPGDSTDGTPPLLVFAALAFAVSLEPAVRLILTWWR